MRVFCLVVACLLACVGNTNAYGIRVAFLKHSPEQMAFTDVSLTANAVRQAREKHTLPVLITSDETLYSHAERVQVTEILERMILQKAKEGDTLILHTIGHGSPSGFLQNVGHRRVFLATLGRLAEKHKQNVIWWQLSCHAAAGMPNYPPNKYVTCVCSSPAWLESPAFDEYKHLGSFILSLPNMDNNADGVVDMEEFYKFMKWDEREELLYYYNYYNQPVLRFRKEKLKMPRIVSPMH